MNIGVKVTPEISEALQKIAFKSGYRWDETRHDVVKLTDMAYLFFIPSRMSIRSDSKFAKVGTATGLLYELFSLDRAVEFLSKPQINIGGYNVEFNTTGIKIGCTNVNWETIEQIYKKRNEYR